MAIEFREVARRLSCEEFARHELPMRGNRAKCPFNGAESGYNLRFFKDGKSYCHSCGKAFDSVQLAAQAWNMTMQDAAVALNKVYNLGVPDGGPDPEVVKRRQLEQAAREAEARERTRILLGCDHDFSKAVDVYTVAALEAKYLAGTPQGADAQARLARAQRRLADIWFLRTGLIWDGDDEQGVTT